jgi:Mg-chelatase subunit ChlD
MHTTSNSEAARRWRLVLGPEADRQATNLPATATLTSREQEIDRALNLLYGPKSRTAGRGTGLRDLKPWLGTIRNLFPVSVVEVLQQDAIHRFGIEQFLSDPEILDTIQPDVQLVASLLTLARNLPEQTREPVRRLVRQVVEDLKKRLERQLRTTAGQALRRHSAHRRPRPSDIDWHRTVRRNLRHYQPELRTVIPVELLGSQRQNRTLHHLVLCVDQSGSMAESFVHAAVLGSVLASLPALSCRFVAFDDEVVDLSPHLTDPVALIFATQLGGGTDIAQALAFCQQYLAEPARTTLVLISDLYEGGSVRNLFSTVQALVQGGVRVVVLLAVNTTGVPDYNRDNAQHLANLGAHVLACTPDTFAACMAAVFNGQPLQSVTTPNRLLYIYPTATA